MAQSPPWRTFFYSCILPPIIPSLQFLHHHQLLYFIPTALTILMHVTEEGISAAACKSACLPAHPLWTTWLQLMEFSWNLIFEYLLKSVQKIEISLKFYNTGTLHENQSTFMIKSRWILLRMRNISGIKPIPNQNTLFYSKSFFKKTCVYETMWKIVVDAHTHTGGCIVRCLCFAYKMNKATDTHSEYIILLFPYGKDGYDHCLSGFFITTSL